MIPAHEMLPHLLTRAFKLTETAPRPGHLLPLMLLRIPMPHKELMGGRVEPTQLALERRQPDNLIQVLQNEALIPSSSAGPIQLPDPTPSVMHVR